MEFTNWIQQQYIPIVLTSATHEVERIVQKNGLKLDDLLNAFTILENTNAPVRTVTQQFTLSHFRIRFVPVSQFSNLPPEHADARLTQLVQNSFATQDVSSELELPPVQSVHDIPSLMESMGFDPLPWFTQYKTEFIDTLRCDESTRIHAPVALVLAVSSSEANPIHCFRELSDPKYLPLVFQNGLYSPNLPIYYLIVHDNYEARTIDPGMLARQVNATFSAGNCKILRLNSLSEQEINASQYDLWTSHPHVLAEPYFPDRIQHFQPAHPNVLGCLLSHQDIDELRSFVWEFALRFVLPALEARITQLNDTVSAVKKGMKNVFKSWLRKPKETVSTTSYRYDSIESQTHLLADTAFIVRDYELALQMYRLVREDYKVDKAWLLYGTVNEMIALCVFLTQSFSPGLREIYVPVEASISAFTANPRLLIRTGIIASEIYRSLNSMQMASGILMKSASMNSGISSAILLDRAALCDLESNRYRKYALRMLMAGQVYLNCGLYLHATRCYARCRLVYDSSGWNNIEHTVHFMLARLVRQLGDTDKAIEFYVKLLSTGCNDKETQRALLEEFSQVVREKSVNTSVADFKVPEIMDSSLRVFAHANSVSEIGDDIEIPIHLKEQMEFEEQIDARARDTKTGYSDAIFEQFSKKNRRRIKTPVARPLYVVNEPLYVEFSIENHLAIELAISNLRLYGEFETNESDDAVPLSDAEFADLESSSLLLPPHCKRKICLNVCVSRPGRLSIQGVKWFICNGLVEQVHEFHVQGPLLQDTREHRAARARATNDMLQATIRDSMPWLGVKTKSTEKMTLYTGEVRCIELELFNHGSSCINALSVQCDLNVSCVIENTSTLGVTGSLIDLSHIQLEPEESISLPVWIRGVDPNSSKVEFLFRYNEIRYVGFELPLGVLPSLSLSHFCRPSFTGSGEYVVGLTIENNAVPNPIQLNQITCASRVYQMESFTTSTVIRTNESQTLFLRLKPTETETTLSKIELNSVDDPITYPTIEFVCLENARQLMQQRREQFSGNGGGGGSMRTIQSIRRSNNQTDVEKQGPNEIVGDVQPPQSFSSLLGGQDGVKLVISWSIEKRFGQSHLVPLTLQQKLSPKVCPLTIAVEYESTIAMSESNPYAELPVRVIIRNDSSRDSAPVSFSFEMIHSNEEKGPIYPYFTWAGTTRRCVRDCAPNQQVLVDAFACFMSPGMYDLNRFRFIVEDPIAKPTIYVFSAQYLVRVVKI